MANEMEPRALQFIKNDDRNFFLDGEEQEALKAMLTDFVTIEREAAVREFVEKANKAYAAQNPSEYVNDLKARIKAKEAAFREMFDKDFEQLEEADAER